MKVSVEDIHNITISKSKSKSKLNSPSYFTSKLLLHMTSSGISSSTSSTSISSPMSPMSPSLFSFPSTSTVSSIPASFSTSPSPSPSPSPLKFALSPPVSLSSSPARSYIPRSSCSSSTAPYHIFASSTSTASSNSPSVSLLSSSSCPLPHVRTSSFSRDLDDYQSFCSSRKYISTNTTSISTSHNNTATATTSFPTLSPNKINSNIFDLKTKSTSSSRVSSPLPLEREKSLTVSSHKFLIESDAGANMICSDELIPEFDLLLTRTLIPTLVLDPLLGISSLSPRVTPRSRLSPICIPITG